MTTLLVVRDVLFSSAMCSPSPWNCLAYALPNKKNPVQLVHFLSCVEIHLLHASKLFIGQNEGNPPATIAEVSTAIQYLPKDLQEYTPPGDPSKML